MAKEITLKIEGLDDIIRQLKVVDNELEKLLEMQVKISSVNNEDTSD